MKRFRIALAALMAVVLAFGGAAGCLKKRPKKTKGNQIYIRVYNGGFGIKWAEDFAKEFNEGPLADTDYEIVLKTDTVSTSGAEVANGTADFSAAFVSEPKQYGLIQTDKLADLSDLLERRPDGGDGPTVSDLLLNREQFDKASQNRGEGYYQLPWGDSFMGYVFDYGTFAENGWLYTAPVSDKAKVDADLKITSEVSGSTLIYRGADTRYYKNGDTIMRAGKDGKYGTYDDGQPQTEAEFNDMLGQIRVKQYKPFISTGQHKIYSDEITYGVMAQYMGAEGYDTFANFDSKGKKVDRLYSGRSGNTLSFENEAVITVDNGYRVFEMEGIAKAYEFMMKYQGNPANRHAACTQQSVSHTDAQNYFLLGYRNSPDNPPSAMLIEGTWWENEATPAFKFFSEKNEPGRVKGARDFRFMLFPDMDGQKGRSSFAARDSSAVYVVKNQDPVKLQYTKDFLLFTLKDENLRKFTRETGVVRPYKYQLTEQDFAQMTPFARTVWDITKDEENVHIVRPMLDLAGVPMNFATSKGTHSILYTKTFEQGAKIVTTVIFDAILKTPQWQDLFVETAGTYPQASWEGYVKQARDQGFYKQIS